MILVAIVLGLVTVIAMAAIFAFPIAWISMLLLGVLHSVDPTFPALGFWSMYWLVIIIRIITAQTSVSTQKG